MSDEKKTRRNYTDKQQRTEWVKKWQVSGQSHVDFAAANGIGVASLRNWIRQASGASTPEPEVESALRTINVPKAVQQNGISGLQVRLPNDVVITIAADASPEWAWAVINGLKW